MIAFRGRQTWTKTSKAFTATNRARARARSRLDAHRGNYPGRPTNDSPGWREGIHSRPKLLHVKGRLGRGGGEKGENCVSRAICRPRSAVDKRKRMAKLPRARAMRTVLRPQSSSRVVTAVRCSWIFESGERESKREKGRSGVERVAGITDGSRRRCKADYRGVKSIKITMYFSSRCCVPGRSRSPGIRLRGVGDGGRGERRERRGSRVRDAK